MSFICHSASDMQFKIISGTTIHEYAEECATATDGLDRVRTMMASDLPNIRIWKRAARLALSTNSRCWRSSKARRIIRPNKADDVAGLKAEVLGASEVARRLKIGRASI